MPTEFTVAVCLATLLGVLWIAALLCGVYAAGEAGDTLMAIMLTVIAGYSTSCLVRFLLIATDLQKNPHRSHLDV